MSSCDVSVVIPAYNAESFVVDALDSIAKQTLLPLEVIVINDGSTDGTSAIVRDWIRARPSSFPLHLIDQPNHGLPATRNVGIRRAVGKWIALLDVDDIWDPMHLQELIGAIGAWPTAVAAYGSGRLLVNGVVSEQLYDHYWDNPSRKYGKAIDASNHLRIDFSVFPRLIKGSFIKPSSLMFSKTGALEIGLFNEQLRTSGEREFQARLLRKGEFVYSPAPITLYRWHDDNITQGKNAKRNIRNGLQALESILSNEDLTLTEKEMAACQEEIKEEARQYLYLCCLEGWHAYLEGVQSLRALYGWRTAIFAVRLSHVARCIVRR